MDPENELDFQLPASPPPRVTDLPSYRTSRKFVSAGNPGDSQLLDVVSTRGAFLQMPPFATERVDADAVGLLRRWIQAMP